MVRMYRRAVGMFILLIVCWVHIPTSNTEVKCLFLPSVSSTPLPLPFLASPSPPLPLPPQGRLFSYSDTHRHRLGTNYHQIPVNCPYRANTRNYQRDGFMCVDGNQGEKQCTTVYLIIQLMSTIVCCSSV